MHYNQGQGQDWGYKHVTTLIGKFLYFSQFKEVTGASGNFLYVMKVTGDLAYP